jgi:hypothetical protein
LRRKIQEKMNTRACFRIRPSRESTIKMVIQVGSLVDPMAIKMEGVDKITVVEVKEHEVAIVETTHLDADIVVLAIAEVMLVPEVEGEDAVEAATIIDLSMIFPQTARRRRRKVIMLQAHMKTFLLCRIATCHHSRSDINSSSRYLSNTSLPHNSISNNSNNISSIRNTSINHHLRVSQTEMEGYRTIKSRSEVSHGRFVF